MTSYGEPRVWLENFPHGQVTPFFFDHLGLRYQGEIIRAARWAPAWGEPLAQNAFFRIVLLHQRCRQRSPKIQDARIALCLPETGPSRRRDHLANETATIGETLGAYRIQQDREGDLIRSTLQRRLVETEEQLLGEESVRYSQGRITTNSAQKPDPVTIFAGLNPEVWFSRLAQGLLANAYPSLPIDQSRFPRAITNAAPPELFHETFRPLGASAGILSQLGPGLGLSAVQNSDPPDFSSSLVAGLIRDRVAHLPSPARWSLVHNYLSHEVGLTGHLATMYLLLYLYDEHPDVEVRIKGGHQLLLSDGSPFIGTRLTGDLIPHLQWNDEIGSWANTIGPLTEPEWNDALPYLSLLSPTLTAIADGEDTKDQETNLLADIAELHKRLERTTEFLWSLGEPTHDNPSGEGGSPTERLRGISGYDFASLYLSIRQIYRNHADLKAGLSALDQLTRLSYWRDEMISAQEYLGRASVPIAMPGLSVQLQALREAASPGPLLRSTRGWEGLAPEITRFKSRYAAAYRSHHQDVHQSLPAYLRELETARRKLDAHALLNGLPELGEPTGDELFEDFALMDSGPPSYRTDPAELDLDASSECQSCGLSLEWTIPGQQLGRVAAEIDGVLEDKNRRLSNLLVERVLEGNSDQRLGDFVTIVEASDLSALSNTLNEDLLAFIRQLLV